MVLGVYSEDLMQKKRNSFTKDWSYVSFIACSHRYLIKNVEFSCLTLPQEFYFCYQVKFPRLMLRNVLSYTLGREYRVMR